MIDKQELLYEYIEKNDILNVKSLINDEDVDIFQYNNYALRISARKGHLEIFNLLLSFDNKYLHYCIEYLYVHSIENGHVDIVLRLLEDKKGKHFKINNTLLSNACRKGHYKMVELLLTLDIPAHSNENYAMKCAFDNKHFNIVDLLWSCKSVKNTLKQDHPLLYEKLKIKDIQKNIIEF